MEDGDIKGRKEMMKVVERGDRMKGKEMGREGEDEDIEKREEMKGGERGDSMKGKERERERGRGWKMETSRGGR
jgi:hypothetical protein